MFDLSLGELSVIGVIALVVLGPERLPKVARFVGLWVRRARAQWYSVKNELERELAAEELQRDLRNARTQVEDIGAQVRAAGEETRKDLEAMREALDEARRGRRGDPDDAATTAPPAAPTVALAAAATADDAAGTDAHPPGDTPVREGDDDRR